LMPGQGTIFSALSPIATGRHSVVAPHSFVPSHSRGPALNRARLPLCNAVWRIWFYWVFGPLDGASAAFGNGPGLSDLELRKVMTSARSLPFGRPAKVMEVPAM